MRHAFFLLIAVHAGIVASAQCSRKAGSSPADAEPKPPAHAPPDHYIQSTFIHRDLNSDDAAFATAVSQTIGVLRDRLKTKARLSIDNENIDCSKDEFIRCREFPAKDAYHFMVVEDSSRGAAIYAIDRKLNEANEEKIEMALLDVFSRHSKVPLMEFGSPKADRILGFVRELSIEEIQKFEEEKRSRKPKSRPSFFARSPFELDLIEPNILEFRMASFAESESKNLKNLNKDTLKSTILENQFVFVHFWTNVQIASIHAHHLWSKAAEKAKDLPAVFASVACHQLSNFCVDDGVDNTEDYYTIVAYKNGERYAVTKNMKDEDYYVNWAKMLIHGPVVQANSEDELKEARKGKVPEFEDVRPAVTVGVFPTLESTDFSHFDKAAELLNGRYHFVYFINEKAEKPSISTFRPNEKTKRADYSGMFDPKSIIEHVTSSSVPSVIDVSRGFTPDLVRSVFKTTLLIHSNWERANEFFDFASKNRNVNNIFMSFNRASADVLPHKKFLEQLNLSNTDEPVLVIYKKSSFRIAPVDERPLKAQLKDLEELEPPQLMLKPSDVNPFKYLHAEAINAVFGHQEVMMLPDPIVSESAHSHGFDNLNFGDAASAGGCPMMAHMNQIRDEL